MKNFLNLWIKSQIKRLYSGCWAGTKLCYCGRCAQYYSRTYNTVPNAIFRNLKIWLYKINKPINSLVFVLLHNLLFNVSNISYKRSSLEAAWCKTIVIPKLVKESGEWNITLLGREKFLPFVRIPMGSNCNIN